MPSTPLRKQTTKAKGLGQRHEVARAALLRQLAEGSACDWCGRPRYRDRKRNWDYNPASTNPDSGKLHADHSKMSRAEAIRRGVPIGLPDRLLHGACNIQRGDGGNDHLAASATKRMPSELKLPWPW